MRKAASRCADCGNVYPASIDGKTVTPIGRASCSRCGGDRFTEIDANVLFDGPAEPATE